MQLPIIIYKMTSKIYVIKISYLCPCVSGKAKPMASQGISQLFIFLKINPTHIISYHEARWDIKISLEDITKPFESLILYKPKWKLIQYYHLSKSFSTHNICKSPRHQISLLYILRQWVLSIMQFIKKIIMTNGCMGF